RVTALRGTDAVGQRGQAIAHGTTADDALESGHSATGTGCAWTAALAGGDEVRGRAALVTVDPVANGIVVDGLGPDDEADPRGVADSRGASERDADSRDADPPINPAEVVALLVAAPELDAFPRGTGVLVGDPPGEVRAKALTHVTAKWAWLAERVPAGTHVLRLSYGPERAAGLAVRPASTSSSAASDSAAAVFPARGAGAVTGRPVHSTGSRTTAGSGGPAPLTRGMPDDDLADLALRDASALLGVTLDRTRLRGLARREWRIPYPAARIGRAEALDAMRERIAGIPGLEAAGTWIAGTGLATVVPSAERAADALTDR
ncbi:MAG: hypothetical protein ACTH31_04025, partial [Pseudoclavibacter sp.]